MPIVIEQERDKIAAAKFELEAQLLMLAKGVHPKDVKMPVLRKDGMVLQNGKIIGSTTAPHPQTEDVDGVLAFPIGGLGDDDGVIALPETKSVTLQPNVEAPGEGGSVKVVFLEESPVETVEAEVAEEELTDPPNLILNL